MTGTPTSIRARFHPWGLLALVIAGYLVLFARAASYGYVWDDVQEIEVAPIFDAPLLDGLTTTQTERTNPTLTELSSIQLAYDSYRPVLFATYWFEIRAWGRSAAPMHVTNLVLGLLAILGVFLLARRLLGPTSLALVPAAVFALHPVQVESVAYISGRGDLLAGTLAIAAALAALRAADGRRAWVAVAAQACAAASETKESVIGLPIAIAGMLWSTQQLRAGRWTLLALAGVIVVYFVVRSMVTVPTTSGALGAAIVQLPGTCLEYLRIALLPFDLSTERLHHGGLAIAGWVVGIVVVGGAIYGRKRYPVAIAGGLWFVVLLGPATVAVTSSGVAADRYLYAPMAGLAIALTALGTALIAAWPRFRRLLQVALAAWAALLVVVTFNQVPVWRSNETLYSHAVTMSPVSSEAFYRLGFLAASNDDWDRAIPLLERSVELDPHNQRALNNLGVGLLRTGRAADAEVALGRAVEANPAAFRAWLNLGLARLANGKRREGCDAVERALAINPGYAAAVQARRTRCRAD